MTPEVWAAILPLGLMLPLIMEWGRNMKLALRSAKLKQAPLQGLETDASAFRALQRLGPVMRVRRPEGPDFIRHSREGLPYGVEVKDRLPRAHGSRLLRPKTIPVRERMARSLRPRR